MCNSAAVNYSKTPKPKSSFKPLKKRHSFYNSSSTLSFEQQSPDSVSNFSNIKETGVRNLEGSLREAVNYTTDTKSTIKDISKRQLLQQKHIEPKKFTLRERIKIFEDRKNERRISMKGKVNLSYDLERQKLLKLGQKEKQIVKKPSHKQNLSTFQAKMKVKDDSQNIIGSKFERTNENAILIASLENDQSKIKKPVDDTKNISMKSSNENIEKQPLLQMQVTPILVVASKPSLFFDNIQPLEINKEVDNTKMKGLEEELRCRQDELTVYKDRLNLCQKEKQILILKEISFEKEIKYSQLELQRRSNLLDRKDDEMNVAINRACVDLRKKETYLNTIKSEHIQSLDEKEKEIHNFLDKLKSYDDKLKANQQEKTIMITNETVLKRKLTSTQAELDLSGKHFEKKDKEINALIIELNTSKQQNSDSLARLEDDLSMAIKLNKNAVKEKNETIASNESLKSSIDYLKKTLEKKLIQLSEEMNGMKNKNESIEKECNDYRRQLQSLSLEKQDMCIKLLAKIEFSRVLIMDKEKESSSLLGEISSFKKEMKIIEIKKDNGKVLQDLLQSKINDLYAERKKKDKHLERMKIEYERNSDKILIEKNCLKEDLRSIEDKMNTLQDENKNIEAEKSVLEKKFSISQNDLKKKSNNLRCRDDELTLLKDQLQKKSEKSSDSITKLEENLSRAVMYISFHVPIT